MSRLVTRAEWGAQPPRSINRNISASSVTAHWAGPSPWPTPGVFDHQRCAEIVRQWQRFHMGTRGWADIAYNLVVCPHGDVFEGRGVNVRSAANGTNTGNQQSYAVCYVGGAGDPFTNEAKVGFLHAARLLGQPLTKVHSDWLPTECPGDAIRGWVKSGAPSPLLPPPPSPSPSQPSTKWKGEPVFLIRAKGRPEVWRTNLVTKTWVPSQAALAVDQVLLASVGLPNRVHELDAGYVDLIPTTKA